MKYHPRKPLRFGQDNSVYFLTFCTFNRVPLLHTYDIPELLIEEMYFYERKIRKLVAYTIMPDHVHLMVEVEQASSLPKFLHSFKSYTSNEIRKRLIDNNPNKNARSRRLPAVVPDMQRVPTGSQLLHIDRVWQPGTMDHCIRTTWESKDFENHLSYIFFNSYKHLGISPKDFPYHNFMEFVGQGVFDESFCAMEEDTIKGCERYE